MRAGCAHCDLRQPHQIGPDASYASAEAIRWKIGTNQPISTTLHRSSRELDGTFAFTRNQDPQRT
jgi:hypothetical protein